MLNGIHDLTHPNIREMSTSERLLHACLCAYAKHHLDQEEIGWEELSGILQNALCEAVGDLQFCRWVEKIKGGKP